MGPSMSVCPESLLEHCCDSGTEVNFGTFRYVTMRIDTIVTHCCATVETKTIVGVHCYATMGTDIVGKRNSGHCWGILLQQWELRSLLSHNSDLGSQYRNNDIGYHCCLGFGLTCKLLYAYIRLVLTLQRSRECTVVLTCLTLRVCRKMLALLCIYA
jgi:hypothetical protein